MRAVLDHMTQQGLVSREADGWYLDRTRGSHRQFKHPIKRGLVTIAGKPSDDLAPGTTNSILEQARLK
jgi:predicted RNA binding protein YcfA (HicA-like mRNA interferase family)